MSEVEVRESNDLVIAPIATVVNLEDPVQAALALDLIRDLEGELASFKRALTEAIVEQAQKQGVTSLELGSRMKAEIKSGSKTSYDATVIEDGLRAAGMPEERISEIVKEEIGYTVKAVELKKAARSNPAYREVMQRAATTYDTGPSVTIRRR